MTIIRCPQAKPNEYLSDADALLVGRLCASMMGGHEDLTADELAEWGRRLYRLQLARDCDG